MGRRCLSLMFFFLYKTVYALPVGNPSAANLLCDGLIWEGHCADSRDPHLRWCDALSFRAGFWGDYVFNRHLNIDHKNHHSTIEHTRLKTNSGVITGNVWDRFDFFTTLGATSLSIDTNALSFGSSSGNGGRLAIETSTHFSWSLGTHITIWECGCTTFGIEGQYFSTNPHVRRVTFASTDSVYPDKRIEAHYREWQIGAGIAHRINFLIPYIAVKWSRAKLNFDHELPGIAAIPDLILFNAKNGKRWGYAVGLSLVDCEKASVTVEGRFSDENGLHVNGQIRF